MLIYKIVDGLEYGRLREKIISKGSDINLNKLLSYVVQMSLLNIGRNTMPEFSNIEHVAQGGTFTGGTGKGSNNRGNLKYNSRKCTFC